MKQDVEADCLDEDAPDEESAPAAPTLEPAAAPPGPAAPTVIEHRFEVEGECHGWRLDRFLQKKMRRLSRARIQRVIRGDCQVEDRPAKPGMPVYQGQQVRFRRPAPSEPDVPRDIRVVHADPAFYVLDKPAGLPIHPTARYHYSTLTAVLRERFPGEALQVAHRLDRETSGLLLVARSVADSAALKQAFARRQVHKRYLAIVHGVIGPDQFEVHAPLGLHGGVVRVRMAVKPAADGGLSARTDFRVVRRYAGHTLVECLPRTGRQHQIRVHLLSVGHPIVGDKLYPDEELFLTWADHGWEAVQEHLPLPRHALHAAGLGFAHPRTGAPVELDCPLPDDLVQFLAGLGPAEGEQ